MGTIAAYAFGRRTDEQHERGRTAVAAKRFDFVLDVRRKVASGRVGQLVGDDDVYVHPVGPPMFAQRLDGRPQGRGGHCDPQG